MTRLPLAFALTLTCLAFAAPAWANDVSTLNADLAREWTALQPVVDAEARKLAQRELAGMELNRKRLRFKVLGVRSMRFETARAPGFSRIDNREAVLRVPARKCWDLKITLDVEARTKILRRRWKTRRFRLHVRAKDLVVSATARRRGITLERFEQPRCRFKLKLKASKVLPSIVLAVAKPFIKRKVSKVAERSLGNLANRATDIVLATQGEPSPLPGGAGASLAPIPSMGPAPVVDFAALRQAMEARRQAYVAQGVNTGGRNTELFRLAQGLPPRQNVLDDLLTKTGGFAMTALLRILYLHGNNPALDPAWIQRAHQKILGFRFWVDGTGPSTQDYWSENLQINYSTCEYLAGARFPTRTFANDGRLGSAKRDRAAQRIRRWIDHRLRFGFAEWNSAVYYPHDLTALFNLIDFAPDADLRTGAAMVVDLIVYDLARLTHKGNFGTSAGRRYNVEDGSAQPLSHGRLQKTGDLVEILFGTRGFFQEPSQTAAAYFCTSSYTAPDVLLGIGVDKARGPFVDRVRMGIEFADGPREGIGFQTLEDGLFWWSMGGYLAPEVIDQTRRMLDAWNLWDHEDFKLLAPLRNAPAGTLPFLSNSISSATRGSVLSTHELYTYRTPEVQLASVQAYRPGLLSFQQHAWEACLDVDAIVFTTAPGQPGRQLGARYWTGNAALPQVTQHRDVVIVIYNPPALNRALGPALTHAWFPRAAFDEVVDAGNWTFGRKGDGYLALYSAQPTTWTRTGEWADIELEADGRRNVWICHVGDRADDGSFASFQSALRSAPLTVDDAGANYADRLAVSYQAPGLGELRVGWGEGLSLDNRPVRVSGYPRHQSVYATQVWGDPVLEVCHAGALLRLDRVGRTRSGDGL